MNNIIHLPVDRTIRAIARQAAREAVHELVTGLGAIVAANDEMNQEAFKGVLERLQSSERAIERLEDEIKHLSKDRYGL